jgi:formamidopyrimidine-DNA glycosylase
MPELPDVEMFKRLVQRHCLGQVIERVVVADPGMLEGVAAAALRRRLTHATVRAARRHGKHLFIEVEPPGALVLHFGTNGSLELLAREAADPDYLRLALGFSAGGRLAYINPRRLGGIGWASSPEQFIAEAELGPDALDRKFDFAAFSRILGERKRDIKSVLMDQALMAGIGNLYSDEILFQAALHPNRRSNELDERERKRLFDSIKNVLKRAVESGAGSEHGIERLPRGFLLPERHRGGHCPRCGGPLATLKRGARTSYFCPRCQPEPG